MSVDVDPEARRDSLAISRPSSPRRAAAAVEPRVDSIYDDVVDRRSAASLNGAFRHRRNEEMTMTAVRQCAIVVLFRDGNCDDRLRDDTPYEPRNTGDLLVAAASARSPPTRRKSRAAPS